MNTHISFQGLSYIPSDHSAAPGQLSLAINLFHRHGELHPVTPPEALFRLPDANPRHDILFIHKMASYTHYIIAQTVNDDTTLHWVDITRNDHIDPGLRIPILGAHNLIGSFPAISSVAAIGHIVTLATATGLAYLRFSGSTYTVAQGSAPFLPIEFMLAQHGSNGETDFWGTADTSTGQVRLHSWRWDSHGEGADTALANLSDTIHGLINTRFEEARKQGCFFMPFFVRYALRMYDGSHTAHSVPVLMWPEATLPAVSVRCYEGSDNTEMRAIGEAAGVCAYYKLRYRPIISRAVAEHLSKWRDIVTHLDIFASAPIYTYDASKPKCDYNMLSGDNSPYYSWATWHSATAQQLYSQDPKQGVPPIWTDPSLERLPDGSPAYPNALVFGRHVFRNGICVPTSDVHRSTGGITSVIGDGGRRGRVPGSYQNGAFVGSYSYAALYPNTEFHTQIRSVSAFYRIAEIPLDKLLDNVSNVNWSIDTNNFITLDIPAGILDTLQQQPQLADAPINDAPAPQLLYAYNSRLHAADITTVFKNPLPIRACVPYYNAQPGEISQAHSSRFSQVQITVWLNINSTEYMVTSSTDPSAQCPSGTYGFNPHLMMDFASTPPGIAAPYGSFPRYIFYPDPRATKMRFQWRDITGTLCSVTIPLTRHEHLNGAYFYGSLYHDPYPTSAGQTQPGSADAPTLIDDHSKMVVSGTDNPFTFPDLGTTTVGTDTILGLSSAAKPLSQGQFGQFPLYAFTSEGVWALEVGSNGAVMARQPITRDVVTNPRAITQLDSSVVFPTARGLMQLSGSQASCLTDIINSPFPLSLPLPHLADLYEKLGGDYESEYDNNPPLSEFLKDAVILYDYPNQRLILANTRHTFFAFLLSLESGLWTMLFHDIRASIPSYPDALALTHGSYVVNYSSPLNNIPSPVPTLLVTRAFTLADYSTLTTVTTAIIRGDFARSHVRTILYGSRNLSSWHLVTSSADHLLRHIHGSPYRYFRLAVLAHLLPDESLAGADIAFTPKFTNRLR